MIKEGFKGVIYGVVTLMLFVTTLFFPPAGIFLPVYKVKKAKELSKINKVIGNLIPLIFIAGTDISLLLIYTIFLAVEAGYFYSQEIMKKLGTFDKIAINSAVTAILLLIVSYIFIEQSGITIEKLEEIYANRSGMKIEDLKGAFEYLGKNIYTITFAYMYLVNYAVFWTEDRIGYEEWRISYLWLGMYVILFFVNYSISKYNLYLENGLNIIQTIVMFFGIKELYVWLKPKVKNSFLAKVLVASVFSISPMILFIFGGIKVFQGKK